MAARQLWIEEGAASLTDLLQAMGSRGWFPAIKPQRWELSFPFEKQPGPWLFRPGDSNAELDTAGSSGFPCPRTRDKGLQHRGAEFPFSASWDCGESGVISMELGFLRLVRRLSACAGCCGVWPSQRTSLYVW